MTYAEQLDVRQLSPRRGPVAVVEKSVDVAKERVAEDEICALRREVLWSEGVEADGLVVGQLVESSHVERVDRVLGTTMRETVGQWVYLMSR